MLVVGVVPAYPGPRTPSFLLDQCPVPPVSTGEDSAPTMHLPPYQPPTAPTPRPLDKPLARERRSSRLHHLFPYNCGSRLPAPADSNARRARFRLARKSFSPTLSFVSPADTPRPGLVAFARSSHYLQIWRYIFYSVATSRPRLPSIANPTTCILKRIPFKRPLHPSVLPPAKRRCHPP